MRDKIFNEILKAYPSCHDLNHKWELTDQILDIPVDGVQVKNTIYGTTKFMRPLTIGEALEILPRMVTGLKRMYCGDAFLTTKDGGIVEVKP